MKKSLLAAFLFFGLAQINAQVTFKPGIKAGLNFSRFTQTDNPNEKFSGKTDFYAAAFGELKLSKFYILQPELMYTRQGSKYEYIDMDNVRHEETLDISYMSLAVANKFTFSGFNFHVGPTIDIRINDLDKQLSSTYSEDDEYYYENDYNFIDFAFFAGVGYNFTKNLGVEARVKKGIIPVNGDWEYTNIVYQVGLSYAFDVKK